MHLGGIQTKTVGHRIHFVLAWHGWATTWAMAAWVDAVDSSSRARCGPKKERNEKKVASVLYQGERTNLQYTTWHRRHDRVQQPKNDSTYRRLCDESKNPLSICGIRWQENVWRWKSAKGRTVTKPQPIRTPKLRLVAIDSVRLIPSSNARTICSYDVILYRFEGLFNINEPAKVPFRWYMSRCFVAGIDDPVPKRTLDNLKRFKCIHLESVA